MGGPAQLPLPSASDTRDAPLSENRIKNTVDQLSSQATFSTIKESLSAKLANSPIAQDFLKSMDESKAVNVFVNGKKDDWLALVQPVLQKLRAQYVFGMDEMMKILAQSYSENWQSIRQDYGENYDAALKGSKYGILLAQDKAPEAAAVAKNAAKTVKGDKHQELFLTAGDEAGKEEADKLGKIWDRGKMLGIASDAGFSASAILHMANEWRIEPPKAILQSTPKPVKPNPIESMKAALDNVRNGLQQLADRMSENLEKDSEKREALRQELIRGGSFSQKLLDKAEEEQKSFPNKDFDAIIESQIAYYARLLDACARENGVTPKEAIELMNKNPQFLALFFHPSASIANPPIFT